MQSMSPAKRVFRRILAMGSTAGRQLTVLDTAQLYRLALEKTDAGEHPFHAVAEEGVRVRDIAEVIGRGLKVPVLSIAPEEAAEHFGWLATFVGRDIPASSAIHGKSWDGIPPDLVSSPTSRT